jgi:uncharacterized repeat protein (TIGR04138 family)
MSLDLKQALAERHRKEGLSVAPDALLWIFANLKSGGMRLSLDPRKAENAREFAAALWRQATAQFGELNSAVFRQWGLPSAGNLANAMRDLAAISAITLDNENEIQEYAALGTWEECASAPRESAA